MFKQLLVTLPASVPHQWPGKERSLLQKENLAATQWLLSKKPKWSRHDNFLSSLTHTCIPATDCINFTSLCHRSQTHFQITFLCHSLRQNMQHHSHVKKKKKNCSSCCLRNLEPACILLPFFVSWSLGQEAKMSHTPCSVDGCSWSLKAVLQQGKSTQKLDSPGKSGGHRSPPEQSARNNFSLTAQIQLLPISPVNFVNPFSRYAGSTRNYLRGRGGIKRFHLAQSPSGGGATKQPGRLIPAQAQQRISPAVQGMTPFSPKQPVPCAGSSCARRAEQLCNRSLWGYAISVLRDFQDQLELQPTWFNVGNNAALSFSSFDLSNFFYLNP